MLVMVTIVRHWLAAIAANLTQLLERA